MWMRVRLTRSMIDTKIFLNIYIWSTFILIFIKIIIIQYLNLSRHQSRADVNLLISLSTSLFVNFGKVVKRKFPNFMWFKFQSKNVLKFWEMSVL